MANLKCDHDWTSKKNTRTLKRGRWFRIEYCTKDHHHMRSYYEDEGPDKTVGSDRQNRRNQRARNG